ncbi:MAG: 1-(5-phosphoribosyl)-5-[(5-phosphoribosylamino)methylideneamino]imidazole-4-carboxamide isomerase [Dehalococcoidia bacterium]
MQVVPAIDLRGGKCVRLHQGDYNRETVFADDPVATGRRWVGAGAERLHIVDLDGARDGVRANAAAVEALVRDTNVPVQLGGGIRTAEDAARMLAMGVDRVIFGTAAIEAPGEVERAVQAHGAGHVMVSVDALDGLVQTRGWTEKSSIRAIDLMNMMVERGVERFMYTDISRDGTLSHPNFDSVAGILASLRYPIVVAGGVATVEDLVQLAEMGVEAAITGTAIYSGALDLQRAIREVKSVKC